MALAQLLSSATCTLLTTRFLSEPLLQNPNPRSSFLKEKCSLRAGRVSCFVSNGHKKLLRSATCTPSTTGFLPEQLSSHSETLTLTLTQDRCSSGRSAAIGCLCFFSNDHKKDEARKALENALSQMKDEF